MRTRVKICGITNLADAEWALDCGADAIGLVAQPESPRYVNLETTTSFASELGPYAWVVAVLGSVNIDFRLPAGIAAVQGEGASLLTGVRRIETVRLRPEFRLSELSAIEGDGILIDAYHPGAFGGTGQRVDWALAAQIVHEVTIPVILAGGLNPENVAEAIQHVKPYAVDVASGVEASPGQKDRVKVRDFIQAAKAICFD